MLARKFSVLNIRIMTSFIICIFVIVPLSAYGETFAKEMFDIDQDGFFESCDDFDFRTLPSDFPIALDTGDVIHTVPAPVSGCQGLTWDGENLWVSSNHHAFHYKVSPVDGAVLATIPAPNDYVEGLAWDGTYLWSVDNDGNGGDGDHVYKLDPSTGDIVESFTSSITWTHGITWDGEYLWFNDFSTHMIYKVDSSNDQILHSFAAPGDQSIGLTWDGAYLWSDNFNTDSLYQIDPADGSIIRMVRSPHTNPRDMAWDGQYLWVVSWASSTIYQVDIGQTSVKDTELLPERFGLEGNYPNPFNANTTIEYTLPEASNVTLEVYTILGQKTATLVNEYQDAGHHTVNWQASNITSGIYYYRIVAGDITQARRMLLLK